jgi:UDP-N-acetylmuramoyl-tripeptide--D-alanyl-D-alanine ligase
MNEYPSLTLSEVLSGLTGHTPKIGKVTNTPISQVIIDSRQALPGAMFVALPGKRADGHAYVADAFQRGAIVALIHHPVPGNWAVIDTTGEFPLPQYLDAVPLPVCIKVTNTLSALQRLATYWRGKFSVRVVGITGSVGKTTTKELTWAVLRRRFSTLKNPGNLNNEIGLPLTLLQLRSTHERVVLEMGMYNLGEITQLCTIARPHIGVVTNVGPTHLERLGSIERIAEAKSELIQALTPGGVAVLNYDDPFVRAMSGKAREGVRIFYYGLTQGADLWASDVLSEGWEGIRFVLHYGREVIHVKVPLLGRHSVHTALCATAVGLIEGMHWEEILPGLQNSGVQLRLVSVPGINGSIILDDTYNASPVSTIAALNLLDDLVTSGRKIAVLGDMAELGDFTEPGHRKVGCRVVTTASLLITVGKFARLIAEEARACGMPAQAILPVQTNQEAIAYLRQIVQPGDIILVKGSRSMAMEEIVAALQEAKGGD